MKHLAPLLLASLGFAAAALSPSARADSALQSGSAAEDEAPLASAAFAWEELAAPARTVSARLVAKGRTLDLEALEIRALAIAPDGPAQPSLSYADFERLVIVKSGLLRATVGDRSEELGPGGVALFLPGEAHRLENAGGEPAVFFSLLFDAERPTDLARGRAAGGSCLVDWSDAPYNAHDRGGHRQNLDQPTAMFERLEMHATTLNGRLTNHPPHTHRAEEMVVMLKGRVEMLLGERWVAAGPGDVIFIESGISHSLRNVGDAPTEYFAFQWQ